MFMFKTLMAIGAIFALGDQCATFTAMLTITVSLRWVEGPRTVNKFHFSQVLKAARKYPWWFGEVGSSFQQETRLVHIMYASRVSDLSGKRDVG